MKSMTGFSEASLNKDGIQFKCFVKSLNSRFIEVNIRLPNNLKKHEGWIRDLIKKSLFNLQKNRFEDGKSTKKDMNRLLAKMLKSVGKIERMEKQNTKHVQKKFERLKKEFHIKNKEINMNEIISSFSKADINEEVVRFKSHLDLVLKLINSKDLIGKKLDFYSQEMLREINTLSSKAMIAEIKNEAVELKSHIEKMKEHAQNVE